MSNPRRLPRPTGAGQPFLSDADRELDAQIELALTLHRERIGDIAREEGRRVLGAAVMEHARFRGIPNEFFVGRRQFAVALTRGWTANADAVPVPFEYPQLFFRAVPAAGHRGGRVPDWAPIKSLAELAEIEAKVGR